MGGKPNPWWRGAVIYQIYPRSFQDTDANGVGDLPGIIERLDYVAGLGVDAIWVSPFFKSPMADFGYDIADYRDVDPLFGTLADFDALVARAQDPAFYRADGAAIAAHHAELATAQAELAAAYSRWEALEGAAT